MGVVGGGKGYDSVSRIRRLGHYQTVLRHVIDADRPVWDACEFRANVVGVWDL